VRYLCMVDKRINLIAPATNHLLYTPLAGIILHFFVPSGCIHQVSLGTVGRAFLNTQSARQLGLSIKGQGRKWLC
jgi:hypothetical protein